MQILNCLITLYCILLYYIVLYDYKLYCKLHLVTDVSNVTCDRMDEQ